MNNGSLNIRNLRAVLVVGLLALVSALLAACGSDPTATPTAAPDATATPVPTALDLLIEAAEAEGATAILESPGFLVPEAYVELEALMEATYGISVDIRQIPGPSMPAVGQRIIQELSAGQSGSNDIYIGNASHIIALEDADALNTFDWLELAPWINPEAVAGKDGEAVLYNSRVKAVVAYNTDLVAREDVPRTPEDFANANLKGLITTTPYASTWDKLALLYGKERIDAMMDTFIAENLSALARCGEMERVASGEFPIFFACGDSSSILELKSRGAPVDFVLLDEVLMTDPQYMVVPKNSENPNTAALFIMAFQLPEAQAIYEKYTFACSHLVEGTSCQKTVAEAKESDRKFMDFNITTTRSLGTILREYQQEYAARFTEGK